MERYSVPVLAEIDTRALVRHLRDNGVMRGVISTATSDTDALVAKARAIRKMDGTDLAKVVSTKSIYSFDETDAHNQSGDPLLPGASDEPTLHVVAYDFGIKQNILRNVDPRGLQSNGSSGTKPQPKTCWRSSPMAFFSRTVPAIPSRSNMPCRRFGR